MDFDVKYLKYEVLKNIIEGMATVPKKEQDWKLGFKKQKISNKIGYYLISCTTSTIIHTIMPCCGILQGYSCRFSISHTRIELDRRTLPVERQMFTQFKAWSILEG